MHTKDCVSFQRMKHHFPESFQTRAKGLWVTELSFSVPSVFCWRFKTEQTLQFRRNPQLQLGCLYSDIMWNCTPVQTLTRFPDNLALSWVCSPAQMNLASALILICFPRLPCFLWQQVFSVPRSHKT